MEGKVVTGMLAAAGAILIGVSLFAITGQDGTPPKITVGDAKLTYKEGDGYEELLADVTAEDNRDRDITDKVFVDRIVSTTDGKHAVVIYGVMDSNNNVTTARRQVNYIAKEGEAEAEETPDEKTKEDSTEKEESKEKPEEKKEEEKGELVPNGKSPVIRLKENEATIKVGEKFDALSYVVNVVDDADSRDELYKHIHIDGDYSTKTPGTYTMKYYATDKNGNASNVETFTLTVE